MYKAIFFFLVLPFASFAQALELKGKVNVPYANIVLQNNTDTLQSFKKQADKDGFFSFSSLKRGNYLLKLTALGYGPYNQTIAIDTSISLSFITLAPEVSSLQAVVVKGKRPTVVRKLDRVELTVENTALSSASAWEILKRAPGVQSGGDQLSVRGSKGILVTINDKKVLLSGEELKAYLEGLDGNQVSSVEVITNPPAKYEATGSAVINIKLKRSAQPGYKGLLSSTFQQGQYARGNLGTSQYYHKGKFAAAGSYSFAKGIYYNIIKEVTRFGPSQQIWEDVLRRKNYRDAEHTYRLGLDYTDSLNQIGISTDGYRAPGNHARYNVPTYVYDSNGGLLRYFNSINSRQSPNHNSNYAINWQRQISVNEKIAWSADYTNYNNLAQQDISTTYYMVDPRSEHFHTDTRQQIRLAASGLDYSNQGSLFGTEAGLRYSHVNASHELSAINLPIANDFAYKEAVTAGYVSLSRELKRWSLKAGLRAEYTSISSRSQSPRESNRQNYLNLFPTLFAQYRINQSHVLGISYGKRIARPLYTYLNPSRIYFSPNSYLIGDARLKPALNGQYSFSYRYKNAFGIEGYYIDEKNPTIQLPYQDNANNMLIQKVTNVPGNRYYGLDLSASLQPALWWSIDLQAGPGSMQSSFGLSDGRILRQSRLIFTASAASQLTFDKKSGFTGTLNYSMNQGGLQGPAQLGNTSSLGAGLRKKLFRDRGELSVMVSDVYRGEQVKVSSMYADQHNYFTYYGDTQNIRIALRYNLGDMGMKVKGGKEKTAEQNRL